MRNAVNAAKLELERDTDTKNCTDILREPTTRIKQFKFITRTKVNSAFHPSGVSRLSSVLWLGLGRGAFICVGTRAVGITGLC